MQLRPNDLRQRIEPLFDENFVAFGDLGAAVSIWQDGEAVLELHGGFRDARREHPWTADTIVLVWSATKAIGSACLLHALQENRIDLARRVVEFWPEFGQSGKSEITIGIVLSHAAGLCALDAVVDVLDYPAVIDALEKQAPLWPPGSAHGYHARTFGFLVDEMTRRITGMSVSQYWRGELGGPLQLDFWIGLPNELNSRTATMYAAKSGQQPQPAEFYRALATEGTLQRRVFTSPRGLSSVSSVNEAGVRSQSIVSFGGIGTAAALAKFYAMLGQGGTIDGRRYFQIETIKHMTTPLRDDVDAVFRIPTAFSAGFMLDSAKSTHRIFGPDSSFGHPGAGGSHAFADVQRRISFAYVTNQMEQSVLPTARSLRLVQALYDAVQEE